MTMIRLYLYKTMEACDTSRLHWLVGWLVPIPRKKVQWRVYDQGCLGVHCLGREGKGYGIDAIGGVRCIGLVAAVDEKN